MGYSSCVWFSLLLVLMGFIFGSDGYTFYVGGKNGWALKANQDYNQWAQKNRFQVNDTLVFKYGKGHNSVLLVTEDNYNKCNKSHPIQSLEYHYGHSEFKLNRSGPFFFISGHNHNCNNGLKLIVNVMAVRNYTHHYAPSPAPTISFLAISPAEAPAQHASNAVGISFSMVLVLSLVLGTFVLL